MGWSMDWVHGLGPWTGSMDWVHEPGPRGGPWTRSIGWSMDPGPCFVYVQILARPTMHCKSLSIEYVMYVYGLRLFYILLRLEIYILRLVFTI